MVPTLLNRILHGVKRFYLHENLIACMELGRTLSCKVSTDAFLFKATKDS
jgi:hypothetical protein